MTQTAYDAHILYDAHVQYDGNPSGVRSLLAFWMGGASVNTGSGGLRHKNKYPRLIILGDERFVVDSIEQEWQLLASFAQWQAERSPPKQERKARKRLQVIVRALPEIETEEEPEAASHIRYADIPGALDYETLKREARARHMMLERMAEQRRSDDEMLIMLAAIL